MKNLGKNTLNPRQKDWIDLIESVMRDPNLGLMRPVVEKELLHYEMFAALDKEGLLKGLTFQGGTCLRLCYQSYRYSEDLDFAGGPDFDAAAFEKIKTCLEDHITAKFGLETTVKAPGHLGATPDHVPVSKWTLAVVTSPGNRSVAKQKIKLEVAAVKAHSSITVPTIPRYEAFGGYRPVLVNAETREEIMSDKLIAFPTSLYDGQGKPQEKDGARIRFRDLWDLSWLASTGVKPNYDFVAKKTEDYGLANFRELVENATRRIPEIVNEPHFLGEMSRFIDASTVESTLKSQGYRDFMSNTVVNFYSEVMGYLQYTTKSNPSTPNKGPKI